MKYPSDTTQAQPPTLGTEVGFLASAFYASLHWIGTFSKYTWRAYYLK